MNVSVSGFRILVHLCALSVLMLAGSSTDAKPAALQSESANFLFDSTTSQEDADLIEEGIRLAQDFFVEELGATIDPSVHVTTRPGAGAQDGGVVAFSMGRSIIIYTGSPGWADGSPVQRLSTVVHEYTHYYQYMRAGERHVESAAWFEEGVAEYLALTALDRRLLLDQKSIESWFATTLIIVPPSFTLTELESPSAFNALGATNYPFAYFAVKEALQGTSLAAVDIYYGQLAEGAGFEHAFAAAFGISPDLHYAVVEEQMATLIGSAEMPDDIAVSEGVENESPVRVVDAPELVHSGEQMVIRARTVEASFCTLVVQTEAGALPIERRTFADGDGDIFWLVTVPDDLPPGSALLIFDCGLEPVEAGFEIAA